MSQSQADVVGVFKSRRAHCAVCLRDDAKLGAPAHTDALQRLLDAHALPYPLQLKEGAVVCAWCEAAAARARRAVAALSTAARVQRLYRTLQKDQVSGRAVEREIVRCNALVEETRRRTGLVHTDVLVVDSTGVQRGGETTPAAALARSAAPTIETVVLDDEDDPAPAPPPARPPSRLVPLDQLLQDKILRRHGEVAALLRDGTQLLTRSAAAPDAFLLYPVLPQPGGTLLVPSLGIAICGAPADPADRRPGAGPLDTATRPVLPVNGGINSDGKVLGVPGQVNSVLSDRGVNSVRGTSGSNSVQGGGNSEKVNGHVNNNDNNVGNLLDNLLNKKVNEIHQTTKRSMEASAADRDDGKKACGAGRYVVDIDTIAELIQSREEGAAAGGGGRDVAKQPLLKSGKIDWEDKIPMDVISFMDATDPLADARVCGEPSAPSPSPPRSPSPSPFGVITDVRSAPSPPAEDPPPRVQKARRGARRGGRGGFIDLR